MTKKLKLSSDFALPLDVASEATAILATRGAGKSYASAVLVEELYGCGVQTIVLDPTGVYWGLRSSASGKGEGLPLYVFGGAHGDLVLEPTAGGLFADLAVDDQQSFVLDLSGFDTKAEQTRFMAAFAERLYRRKAQNRTTLHLIIDEADEFAPQRPMKDEPKMLGAMEALVRRGRSRGLGVTLITQRSAALNKNVLDLVDTLIVMRVTGPRDRKQISDWVNDKDLRDELGVLDSLPSLPTGTGWVWSPVRGILEKIAVRRIRTFDSYRTPKPGEVRAEPKAAAKIDLAALGEKIAATVERTKASDPRELRRRISGLEAELRKAQKGKPPPAPKVERVEVPVLKDAQVKRLETVTERWEKAGSAIVEVGREIAAALRNGHRAPVGKPAANYSGIIPRPGASLPAPAMRGQRGAREVSPKRRPTRPTDGGQLPKGERKILVAVAQHDEGVTREQLTVLTSYRRSTRDTYLQRLQERGLVQPGGYGFVATPEGISALGDDYEPLPTGSALLAHHLSVLPAGERRILEILAASFPSEVARSSIDEQTGYARSSRDTYLQRLGARRLVDDAGRGMVRASEMLFD